jgi:hypothetical protein
LAETHDKQVVTGQPPDQYNSKKVMFGLNFLRLENQINNGQQSIK